MATTLSPITRRDNRIERLHTGGRRQRQPSRLPFTRAMLLSQDPAADADLAWAVMEFRADPVRPVPPGGPVHQALHFYDAELRPKLEPQNNGKYIAIHPDTQEYIVEQRPGKSFRALRARQPTGPIVLHHIGIASTGLKERLRGERPR